MNLFIIGNGFDYGAHNLKTSYNYFKDFVLKKEKIFMKQ
nr:MULTISPECIES: AbiH family protein [unclassified Staphylococcus]